MRRCVSPFMMMADVLIPLIPQSSCAMPPALFYEAVKPTLRSYL